MSQPETSRPGPSLAAGSRAETPALGFGVAVATLAAIVWVVLTARTGVTYHLFPLVMAAAASVIARAGGQPALSRREAALAAAAGLLAVAMGWAALAALDEVPTATFVADQPGGVAGETVLFTALGSALGLWWATRGRGPTG